MCMVIYSSSLLVYGDLLVHYNRMRILMVILLVHLLVFGDLLVHLLGSLLVYDDLLVHYNG